jgi:hypothetical protein
MLRPSAGTRRRSGHVMGMGHRVAAVIAKGRVGLLFLGTNCAIQILQTGTELPAPPYNIGFSKLNLLL